MSQLQTLLPFIPEDTVFIDKDARVAHISSSLESFFITRCKRHHTLDNVIGLAYRELWNCILSDSPHANDLFSQIDRLTRGEIRNLLVELPSCHNDSSRSIFLNLLNIPKIQGYLIVQQIDITEWLRSELTSLSKLNKLQEIINSHDDMICLMTPDGRLSFVNNSFCKHFSSSYEDLLNKPFTSLLPNQRIIDEFFQKLNHLTPDSTTFTIQYLQSDYRTEKTGSWIEWTVKAIFDGDHRIVGLTGIGRETSVSQASVLEKGQEQTLLRLAFKDTVTGLPNRLLFIDRLNQLIIRAKRYRIRFAVLFLDIDNFKKVNESLGYDTGDNLLKALSLRLSPCLRDSDVVSRIGGDDFAIILTEIDRSENTVIAVRRILNSLKDPFSLQGHVIYVTASIGISVYPEDGDSAERLLKNAETAMYYAKSQEKNSYQFFNPGMNQYAVERLNVESDIRRAIDSKEFVLHFQPQISIKSGKVVGAEALVRWLHPEKGQISPMKFIPIAEETGLIIPMSELIINQALQQAKLWFEMKLPKITVAVNISLKHFRQNDFQDFILDTIHDIGVDPSTLELELTESILMHDAQSVIKTLNTFKSYGIQTSIDDFGTGYSSLSYLKNLPVSKLKIDRSFVNNITIDQKDAMIVKTIIEIAHNLGLKVIAEGVEHIEQMKFLGGLGCDELQGYLFSKPLPPHEFKGLIEAMTIL